MIHRSIAIVSVSSDDEKVAAWLIEHHRYNIYIFFHIITSQQLDESNANRLVLRSISAETAGRFRCEVSAEAPSFETVSGHADMTVVRKCH